jgi:hypothetical protein
MTDFFADLEAELRSAHPRRSRPVVPVGALVVAASVLVAIVSVATFLPAGEREVAREPASAPAVVACTDEPPRELTEAFAVLRRPADPMPEDVSDALDRGIEDIGLDTTVFGNAARRVGEVWVVPVVFGPSCDDTSSEEPREPGMVAVVAGRTIAWGGLDEIRASGLKLPAEDTRILVVDGTDPDLRTGDGRLVTGSLEDSVLTYPEPAQLASVPRNEPQLIPGGACGTTFTSAPAPEAVADALGVFRSDLPHTGREQWMDRGGVTGEYLRGAHVEDARVVHDGRRSGRYWFVLPVSDVPVDHHFDDCSAPREPAGGAPRPGACAVHSRGDGAANEQKAGCWTLEEIEAGEAFTEFRDGKLRTIFGLVPDSAEMVEVWDGAETRPEHNLLLFFTQEEREVRLRLKG